MKICVFTSAHLVNDIRIFKKEIGSLLKNNHEIVYYTNKIDKSMDQQYVKTTTEAEFKNKNLKIIYNEDYNEEKRFKRFFNSILTFFRLDKGFDVYHFHDPDLIVTGMLLKLIGKKVVYDVHEDYTNTILEKEYIPVKFRKIISFLFSNLERFASKKFNLVICATPTISQKFIDKGIKNVITINNYPFANEFISENQKQYKENRIIYTGAITKKRGIVQIINAMELINKKLPCKLTLAGQIQNGFDKELTSLNGWKYIDYKGLLSREKMAKELHKSKIGVIFFLPERNHIDAQPNKLFEYMSAKLPIACSNFYLWEEIVLKNKIGKSADPLNSEEIAKIIINMINMQEYEFIEIGKKEKKLVDTIYNWSNEEKKLVNAYTSLEEKKQ